MRSDRRQDRQAEAIDRQATYDALDTSQKIARAEQRRGNSSKELNRLRSKVFEMPAPDPA